jgi:hypothetical protein
MKNNSGNHFFPWPVLGNKKEFRSSFDFLNHSVESKNGLHCIKGFLFCGNKKIVEYLLNSKCEAWCHIECERTSFRSAFKISNWQHDGGTHVCLEVKKGLLRGRCELGFFITATSSINNYIPEDADPVFAGTTFEIPPKGILGIVPQKYFIVAEKTIKSTGASIFIFDSGLPDKKVYWDYDRRDGKIGIMVPPKDLSKMKSLKNSPIFAKSALSSYVLPALTAALKEYFSEDNYPWKRYMEDLINREKLNISSVTSNEQMYQIAQDILGKNESIFTNMLDVMLAPNE